MGEKPHCAWYTAYSGVGALEPAKKNRQVCLALDHRQTCLYSQVMLATKIEGSVRDRLLIAADELFYRDGVHRVGIDRVIERAGVAKASLYAAFGSKEELVVAYLEARAQRITGITSARL